MDEHPISLDKAKGLLAGDLGDVYRQILADCCVPIYWFKLGPKDFSISHNGTLTIVQTPKVILGITAAHVFRCYEAGHRTGARCLDDGSVAQTAKDTCDDPFGSGQPIR